MTHFTDDQITELIASLHKASRHATHYQTGDTALLSESAAALAQVKAERDEARDYTARWSSASDIHASRAVRAEAENAALRDAIREAREAIGEVRGWNGLVENAQLDRTRHILSAALAAENNEREGQD